MTPTVLNNTCSSTALTKVSKNKAVISG